MKYQKPEITIYEADELKRIDAGADDPIFLGLHICPTTGVGCTNGAWCQIGVSCSYGAKGVWKL